MRALLASLACAVLLAGCGHGGGLAAERRGDLVYETGGEGPGRVTVIRPADAAGPLPLVLFLHGWGATETRFYRPWLEHLAHEGNAVIYPRYQDSFAEPPPQVLGNVLVGVREALEELHDADLGSLVVAGHSAGGALAADYAAIARDARAIHEGAERVRRKRYEVITTPGADDHLGPQRATRVSRETFWARLDALIAKART